METINKDKYKKAAQKKKLHTYINMEDIERLEVIKVKFGFKSTYQILQYLTQCFLRVADPENDPILDPVSDEIQDMFFEMAEAEKNILRKVKATSKTPDDI